MKNRRTPLGVALALMVLALAAALVPLRPDAAGQPKAQAAAEPAPAEPKPLTHHPLRENVPYEMPEPTTPVPFGGYPGAPAFKVVPRKDQLSFHPCTTCHATQVPNPTPRKLDTPHPAALSHGLGQVWCLDCHTLKDRDVLHLLSGRKVDFNESYLVCVQCHANRGKDWYFGGHGKRVDNWKGEREIYSCTHCHDPHSPTLKPREPSKPPPVRAGLQPMQAEVHHPPPVWVRDAGAGKEAGDGKGATPAREPKQ